jgi:hypothetical protein
LGSDLYFIKYDWSFLDQISSIVSSFDLYDTIK